jgi:NADPH2:quinone reductase
MDQVVLTGVGGPDRLRLRRAARPLPGRGKVVVHVEAAGISFAEVQLLQGLHPFPPRLPAVPGYDLVGRISAVGPGVTGYQVGDRVAAMPRVGAWQEYVTVPEGGLAPVPEDLDAPTAVSLVCNGVTAWQMLHRRARVRPGETVLVQGAGGGVGTVLTSLAVHHGARVIGTASPGKHDALRGLGAEPLDYRGDLRAAVRGLAPNGVAAVFDHIGGTSLDLGWSLLARGGTLVSFDSSVQGYQPGQWFRPHVPAIRRVLAWKLRGLLGLTGGRRATMFYVRPGDAFREDLAALFDLVRKGVLRPAIAGTYPLAKAPAAITELMERRTLGKLVLVP